MDVIDKSGGPKPGSWIGRALTRSSAFTVEQAYQSLGHAEQVGKTRRFSLRRALPFMGPAFIAAVAYIDPGNFATNISAGAQYGYLLLWVILASNLMAVLIQTLSAKLASPQGATCRSSAGHLPSESASAYGSSPRSARWRPTSPSFWRGGRPRPAFGMPLLLAGLITGAATFAILALQRFGFRPLEIIIAVLVSVIAVSYLLETILARPDWDRSPSTPSRRKSPGPAACCSRLVSSARR